jgi:L-rhamnose-H+ transport protein
MRNGTWTSYGSYIPIYFSARQWGCCGSLAAGAIYGLAAHQLGRPGDSAGWAIYQITMVPTASAAGVHSGEWKNATARSVRCFTFGIATLVVAVTMAASATR